VKGWWNLHGKQRLTVRMQRNAKKKKKKRSFKSSTGLLRVFESIRYRDWEQLGGGE
jgi:hypothetical protein